MTELERRIECYENNRIYVIGCDGEVGDTEALKPWEWLSAPTVQEPRTPFYLQSATGAKIPISHEDAAFIAAACQAALTPRLRREPLPSER